MHPVLQENIAKVGKPYKDLLFFLECFSEVLEANNEKALIAYIPWLNEKPEVPILGLEQKVVHLYSICFQLLNLCEVNWAVQSRRNKQQQDGLQNINGSWSHTFAELKNKGVDENAILEVLGQLEVEPVLTAHPTEAKRTVVLKYYREIYLQLVKLENSIYTSVERLRVRDEIKQIITRLWYIDDIYLEKPKVETELENMLYYLTNVFPDVFDLHDKQLQHAWLDAGFDPSALENYKHLPKISLGTWVGGDRDGHPLVTAETTEYALKKLRTEALRLVRERLLFLADSLSIYTSEDTLPSSFLVHKNSISIQIGAPVPTDIKPPTWHEPFRQYVLLLVEKLPIKHDSLTGNSSLSDSGWAYSNSNELLADLEILLNALVSWGAPTLAKNEVLSALRFIDNFGFHLAHLDIRQNSAYNQKALLGLLDDVDCNNLFIIHNDAVDKKFLLRELMFYRPFTRTYTGNAPETANVLQYLNVLSSHIGKYDTNALGMLIVSMTRKADDLFTLYLLAREAGLYIKTPNGPACQIPIVPLFETIEDLKGAAVILDEFLAHPVTQNTLKLQMQRKGYKTPVAEVMIGYSDSNKDGGILASQWHLFETQFELTHIGHKHGVNVRFFHGKGGSISRGAGPMHWFLRSLPPGSLCGKIRLTEQGETIERKYANKVNAAHNLELLASGTLYNTLISNNPIDEEFLQLMGYMSDQSYKAYTALTRHPKFINFFEQATPIDAIETSKIGSRPSRRNSQRTLSDLRAIPWVFSWSQCRINITSWYGVGTTLKLLKENEPQKYQLLCKLIPTHPLVRYLLTNVDSGLASTDLSVIERYASLVTDKEAKQQVLPLILSEYRLTQKLLAELLQRPFEVRRQNHYFSTRLRAIALEPMHNVQVNTLRLWRENKETEVSGLLNNQNIVLLKTINAIANALGATG